MIHSRARLIRRVSQIGKNKTQIKSHRGTNSDPAATWYLGTVRQVVEPRATTGHARLAARWRREATPFAPASAWHTMAMAATRLR